MQKIIPHLWFDTQAVAAAQFYKTVFANSQIKNITTLKDTPSGDCDIVSFEVRGFNFMAISAGPHFKINPAISFMVNYDPSREPDAAEQLEKAWKKLIDKGTVLMPLQEYPFSKLYGWVQDKFGVSWQLMLTDPTGEPRPTIIPSLLFVKDMDGKAEAAMNFYCSVFKKSQKGTLVKYGSDQPPHKPNSVMYADFKLFDIWISAMDGGVEHSFDFTEAVSFVINCEDQAEVDYYWEKLSAVPEAEQCGWLKDAFGVSWQVVPVVMEQLMRSKDQAQINRVTQAFLKMKKFDIAELEKAASKS